MPTLNETEKDKYRLDVSYGDQIYVYAYNRHIATINVVTPKRVYINTECRTCDT